MSSHRYILSYFRRIEYLSSSILILHPHIDSDFICIINCIAVLSPDCFHFSPATPLFCVNNFDVIYRLSSCEETANVIFFLLPLSYLEALEPCCSTTTRLVRLSFFFWKFLCVFRFLLFYHILFRTVIYSQHFC